MIFSSIKNKRATSPIIATILIILITITAVTIIWTAIIPMIAEEIGIEEGVSLSPTKLSYNFNAENIKENSQGFLIIIGSFILKICVGFSILIFSMAQLVKVSKKNN